MILPREIEEILRQAQDPERSRGVRSEIRDKIVEAGAELIEIRYRKVGPKSVITFIVDKDRGITLEECVAVNRNLSAYFDSLSSQIDETGSGPIQGPYLLEVSSPGLDRPLVSERDFERAAGQTVRITARDSAGIVRTSVGKLTSVKDGVLYFELEGAKGKTDLNLASVIKAVREVRFHK